jgi:hypothetical protein
MTNQCGSFQQKKNIFVVLGMRVISPWLIIYEAFFACSMAKNVFKIKMEMAFFYKKLNG